MGYIDDLINSKEIDVLERRLLFVIGQGYENAVPRKHLCRMLRTDDRSIRWAIESLRKHIPIINLQDGKGYFIPTKNDRRLVERYLMQEESRARNHDISLDSARAFLGSDINVTTS